MVEGIVFGVLILHAVGGFLQSHYEKQALRSAPAGGVRVESVKARKVKGIVGRYGRRLDGHKPEPKVVPDLGGCDDDANEGRLKCRSQTGRSLIRQKMSVGNGCWALC